jgi:DNA polymerase elongation subunit (family B)
MKEVNLDALLEPVQQQTRINKQPKILTLDIETSPNVADVWGLWNQNIAVSQIREPSRVLCFAAKWYGKKTVEFYSEHHDGHEEMVRQAWRLLNETDILATYNGPAFDVKHLQREFAMLGLTPPSPFRNVDLLKTARAQFKFPSNKLDYVSQALGIGKKVPHTGHSLWTQVLAGDTKAWNTFKKYCIQDVRLTEQLLDVLGPWVKNFPHQGLWNGNNLSCYRCGGDNLHMAGLYRTNTQLYTQVLCGDCGAWSKVNKAGTKTTPIA